MSSNCTFMELKSHKSYREMKKNNRSNCTFMELKCLTLLRLRKIVIVLIVPLWN